MVQVLCALLYIIRCKNGKKRSVDRFRSVGRTGLEPVTIETQTTTSTMLKFSKLVFIFYLIFTLFCAVFAPILILQNNCTYIYKSTFYKLLLLYNTSFDHAFINWCIQNRFITQNQIFEQNFTFFFREHSRVKLFAFWTSWHCMIAKHFQKF